MTTGIGGLAQWGKRNYQFLVLLLLLLVLHILHNLNKDMHDLKKSLNEGFREIHNFGADRASLLENCSEATFVGTLGFTSHAVYYKDYVTMVSVSARHLQAFQAEPGALAVWNASRVACPDNALDISLSKHCPTTAEAIEITSDQALRAGDQVVTHGYGDYSKVWTGYLSGVLGSSFYQELVQKGLPVVSGEMFFTGLQQPGMSGAAILNGCSYVGVAHIAAMGNSLALAIPSQLVKVCMEANARLLKRSSQCPLVTRRLPPSGVLCR